LNIDRADPLLIDLADLCQQPDDRAFRRARRQSVEMQEGHEAKALYYNENVN
jgi:hypothetical protein